jgi:PEP-CTERM motif
MKMKVLLSAGVLTAVLALSVCALADPANPDTPTTNEVVYLGNTYCVNQTFCPEFAFWAGIAGGYVQFNAPNGTPAEYIWTNSNGTLTFEDLAGCGACTGPPAYDQLLATLQESPNLQQVNQYFPGAAGLPLFVLSNQVPEPSTLLLLGSAGVLAFGRIRRFRRS